VAQEEQANALINNQSQSQNFFCNIEIAGVSIPPRNIAYLAIREWATPSSFIPRLELSVIDDGLLTELKTPHYTKKVFIELGRNEDDDSPINITFDIYDYTIDKVADLSQNMISISGLISMDNPFTIPQRPVVYDQQSSKSVIENIANSILSGEQQNYSFVSGNANPSDSMNWIQSYQSNIHFIKHVMNKSFIGDNDALICYVDANGKFHYEGIVDKFNDTPLLTARFDIQLATALSLDEMGQKAVEKGYTEEQGRNDIWYSSINLRDYSGTLRNTIGLTTESTYFNRKTSEYLSKLDNINIDNTDANIYNDVIDNKTVYNYTGTYGINEHDNVNKSVVLRNNILGQLFSQSVLLEINSYSNVQLLDTIELLVHADIKDTNAGFPINEKLSGVYIVGGITHTLNGSGSIYKKIITLYRVGVNKVGFSGIGD
jgi:hypothetical protein